MEIAQLGSSTATFQRRGLSNKNEKYRETDLSTNSLENVDPPTYEEVAGSSSLRGSKSIQWKTQNQIRCELGNLEAQLDRTRKQKQEHLNQDDEDIIHFLVLHIKDFLMNLSQTTFRKATLLIIPDNAVDPLASPCDGDLWSAEEYCQLLRINTVEMQDTIWKDGEEVQRLAKYLQPEKTMPRSTTTQPSKQPSPTKPLLSSRRPLFRRASKPRNQEGEESNTSPHEDEKKAPSSNVLMTVRGEEVVFRLENSLGLYESQRAWGLVVKIYVTS